MYHRLLLPGLLACVLLSPIHAQPTQPTTAPTTDLSTPKGTLRTLVLAMEAGDVATLRDLFHTEDEPEERMAQAMADVAVAHRRLRKAAIQAYGQEGAESFLGPPPGTESLEAIEQAQVSEQDGHAVVRVEENSSQPVRLVRTEGGWKVSMEDQARKMTPEVFEQQIELVGAQVGIMDEVADEIAAGKYPAPAEAGEALRTRSMQAAFGAAQGQDEGGSSPGR